ncbi:MAG TPA: histidine kinase [Gaiellaceae bacterium]|nr:histidine kinase [Gaiellaceae bacterium]
MAGDAKRSELTEQVLAAEQDERRRIALFLHDGPVQSLSGVALMLDATLALVESNPEQAQEVLAKALARTRTTIVELRDLSFNLEPVVLRDHGFAAAVHALAQSRGIEHGIQVVLDVAAVDALGEQEQAAIYQIVREALEGSIRRGPPRLFSVTASGAEHGRIQVEIRDDAPAERRRRSREVLEERARTLGASLSVDKADGENRMTLVLPGPRTSE